MARKQLLKDFEALVLLGNHVDAKQNLSAVDEMIHAVKIMKGQNEGHSEKLLKRLNEIRSKLTDKMKGDNGGTL